MSDDTVPYEIYGASVNAMNRKISALTQEVERLRGALLIIAGKRQCMDNLMSHAEIARAALDKRTDAMTPEEIERVARAMAESDGVKWEGAFEVYKQMRRNHASTASDLVEQILRDRPLPDDLTDLERTYQDAAFQVQLISEKIEHVRLQMKRDEEKAIADARREMTK